MLLYKNHRFHCEGVSFAIPDGYGLDTSYEEVPEDTLHLWSEDESLYIRIGIERETKGPFQELAFVLRELEECVVEEEPTGVVFGGLSGYSSVYTTGDRQYLEIRLSISGKGNTQTELIILMASNGELPTEEKRNALLEEISPRRA